MLVDGFREVVPLEWLRAFDERELEVYEYITANTDARSADSVSLLCIAKALSIAARRCCCRGCRRWRSTWRTGVGTRSTGATRNTANRCSGSGAWCPNWSTTSACASCSSPPAPAVSRSAASRSSSVYVQPRVFLLSPMRLLHTSCAHRCSRSHVQAAMVRSASASRNSVAPTRCHAHTPASTASISRFNILLLYIYIYICVLVVFLEAYEYILRTSYIYEHCTTFILLNVRLLDLLFNSNLALQELRATEAEASLRHRGD